MEPCFPAADSNGSHDGWLRLLTLLSVAGERASRKDPALLQSARSPAAASVTLIAAGCRCTFGPGAARLSAGNQLALCTLYSPGPRAPGGMMGYLIVSCWTSSGLTGANFYSCQQEQVRIKRLNGRKLVYYFEPISHIVMSHDPLHLWPVA